MKKTSILIPCVFEINMYTRAQLKNPDDILNQLSGCVDAFGGIHDAVDIYVGTNSDVDLSRLNAKIVKIDTRDTESQFLPMRFFRRMRDELATENVFACESDMIFHGHTDLLLNNDRFVIRKIDPAYKGYLRRAYNLENLKYPYSRDSYYQETIEINGEKYGVLKDTKNHGNFKCSTDTFNAIPFAENTQSFDPVEESFNPIHADFVENAYMINLGGEKFNEEHYLKQRYIARNRNFPHTFNWRQSRTFKYRCTDDVKELLDLR